MNESAQKKKTNIMNMRLPSSRRNARIIARLQSPCAIIFIGFLFTLTPWLTSSTALANAFVPVSSQPSSALRNSPGYGLNVVSCRDNYLKNRRDLSKLSMSLKPAAIPLMDSGKALARSGELLIDLTTKLDLYGGSLSATGASIRNCGDCLAQAAASCRFKTAAELVIDEMREGADCLREGRGKLSLAIEESKVDGDAVLMGRIESMIGPMQSASGSLEEAGAAIMRREAVDVVGGLLMDCGEALGALAIAVEGLDPESEEGKLSSQRMGYSSQQMILAGKELRGEKKEKAVGKSWIKG
mmetsp:Transcript_9181/g.19010  ORF Transcript_9181/g.19010 Transcript_9181/m.19010 type:complete len:299 (+) Transcript_9181:61-957(+)